jgi:predicted PurR-regulated permease PerM
MRTRCATICLMLGIDRAAARNTWTALVVVLGVAVVYLVRQTLFVFILALLFAYLLSPLVELLDRLLPGSRTRAPALALAYLLVMGILVWAGVALGSRMAEQANALVVRIPDLLAQARAHSAPPGSWMEGVIATVEEQVAEHAKDILSLLPAIGRQVLSAAGGLVIVVIVPILSFFFLKDGRLMQQSLLQAIDNAGYRTAVEEIARDVDLLLAQYVRALTLLCLATFVAFTIFFELTGVPYSLLLAAAAGLLEFIPVIGPLSAAILILIVAAFSGYPHFLWIGIFLGINRIFQDYVLAPRLMSAGMELHPLLVMFGVFAGGELGGIPGTLLSVPVLALARILYRQIQKTRVTPETPARI